MMNPLERSCHPSRNQLKRLLDIFDEHPEIGRRFSRVPIVRNTTRKKWEKIAIELNGIGGCVKSGKQWTKYWADKKSAVRKKAACGDMELSEPEERIVKIIRDEITDKTSTENQEIEQPSPNVKPESNVEIQQLAEDPLLNLPRSPSPQSEPQSRSSSLTERFLNLEEQRIAMDLRSLQLQELLVNHQVERDRSMSQALLSIGEGLKLLAENLKK